MGWRGTGRTADLRRVYHGHHAVLAVLPRVLGAVDRNGVGVVDRDTEDLGLLKGLVFEIGKVIGQKGWYITLTAPTSVGKKPEKKPLKAAGRQAL